ncbi:MAG: hypothetical protein ABR567_06360 [Myxococcales bacterium]
MTLLYPPPVQLQLLPSGSMTLVAPVPVQTRAGDAPVPLAYVRPLVTKNAV